nr:uncharacterized protein LOC133613919 isoform X9 [Nerophis lumbriciformis]
MCERTIAEYEEELCPTKEEKERQHEKHQVVLHTTDIHQLIGHQEECLPHLQGNSFTSEDPQPSHFKGHDGDPQPPYFKEEEEGECVVGQEEDDVSKFPLTVVSVKTEEHEDKAPESSQLHHSPNVQQPLHIKKEEDDPQPTHIKEEAEDPHMKEEEEEECVVGQEEDDVSKFPLTVVSVKTEEHEDKAPESSQLHHSPNVCEEQLLPEKQESSFRMLKEYPPKRKTRHHGPSGFSFSSLTQTLSCKKEEEDSLTPHIKEEEAEQSISQEGDHIEGLVEFPVTGVPVKSEDDEVKGESEEKREAEPPSSSSTQHMTTEADGDHCGGSQADKILAPLSDNIHQLIGHQEECLHHLQGDSFTSEDPQASHMKEEEEGECPVGQEEDDVSKFPLTVVSVKTEEHEDKAPESSQLHHSPNVQQPLHIKKEEDDPQPTHIKEEAEDPHMKEEEEEECVVGQEEDDVSKFPLTVVSVKTEEHEDKAPESSQLHHSPNVQRVSAGSHEEEWHTSVGQKELQAPSHIKEEQLHDEDEAQSLQLHHSQSEENRGAELPANSQGLQGPQQR